MLATPAGTPPPRLDDPRFVYEPKYDGIRVLVEIRPRKPRASVRLFSRLGNDKSAQFPEIVEALGRACARLRSPIVVDGELVALNADGEPDSFLRLQGRMHRKVVAERDRAGQPVALVLFDLLRQGARDLRDRPLTERRARLEKLLGGQAPTKRGRESFSGDHRAKKTPDPFSQVRLSEVAVGDGQALFARALEHGWEGLIVKRADSPYRAGKRSPDWRKLKLVRQQEFVVCGWTRPGGSRSHFGALLLGYYDHDVLEYAGRVGSGFDEATLTRISELLRGLETRRCPFDAAPKTSDRPHWVEPRLVAEIKFAEWTEEGLLRQPTFVGLRDDVKPRTVRREKALVVGPVVAAAGSGGPGRRGRVSGEGGVRTALEHLHDDLQAIEAEGGTGVVSLPGDVRLSVTNLKKVFWPEGQLTKGELLRYYVRVAPYLLPVVEDRPLVMKRLPNGIEGKAFYQQRAPDTVPAGVRVETVEGDTDVPARLVGGSLVTLLHMAQLASISQDPWFSRVQSPHVPDHAAIDLDPGDGVPFSQVRDTARWVRDELEAIGVNSFPKTSGADGLHIFIPLDPGTPYEAGMIFCQIVATVVAQKHPLVATVERSVRARGKTVYIDYLQNIEGKTLACAYSARASEYAGASTPLTWKEIDDGVDRRDFTIRTLPARLDKVGDLWAGLRKARGANLLAVERYLGS